MNARLRLLAAALALAAPVASQTVSQPRAAQLDTEKWWRIETSGIGG